MTPQFEYALLYLEINIVSIILIGIIRYKTGGISKMVAQRNFGKAINALMVFIISDTLYVMSQSGLAPGGPVAIMIYKELYFFATTLMCFYWFVYFEYMQDSPFVKSRKRVRITSFLVHVMVLLLIINLFTGILFYVDEVGVYRRGKLFIIQYLLSYVYVFVTSFRAFIGLFRKDKLAKRKKLIALALFPIAPAGAGIMQFIYPRLPLACAAIALATLVLYLNWIDEMISVDALTMLGNHKELTYDYEQWQQNISSDIPLYLMIIDANKFKVINDTYGHIEGDAALLRIADAMRLACRDVGKKTCLIRYGGDEFVILLYSNDLMIADELKTRINDHLSVLNSEAAAPYDLSVSIGFAKAKPETELKDLIEEADSKLYEAKNKLS